MFVDMNKFIITLLIGIALSMTACSDDNTVFNEPTPIRSYESDAEVISQFVDIDSRTGLFFINPDKKVMATDYVVNRSREQLAEVSSINRTRFEGEMAQANNLIKAYTKAGNASVIYTTRTSGSARNNDRGAMCLLKCQSYSTDGNTVARLSVSGEEICKSGFYSNGNNRLTINSDNTSMFYVAQISFVTSDETNKGTILLTGVGRNSLPYIYSLSLPEVHGEYLNMQGKSLIGNGSVTVNISE